MRLACVMRAKNECDIVEAFVRHHAALFDTLYIVDHRSADTTGNILRALKEEGLPIVIGYDGAASHYQGGRTTEAIRSAMNERSWDFVFPLDCDEFMCVPNREELELRLRQLPADTLGIMQALHFTPTESDDDSLLDVPRRIRHHVTTDTALPPTGVKVVVPGTIAADPSFAILEGNHGAQIGERDLTPHLIAGLSIYHYPVRSVEQFLSKAVVAQWSWMTRRDYHETWAAHIREFYDVIRTGRMPTTSDLMNAAFLYAQAYLPQPVVPSKMRYSESPLLPLYDGLRYADMINVDTLSRTIAAGDAIAQHLAELHRTRARPHKHRDPVTWLRQTLSRDRSRAS